MAILVPGSAALASVAPGAAILVVDDGETLIECGYGHADLDERIEINDYDPFNDMLGAGGIYATLHDLEAWARTLATDNPFPDEAFKPGSRE